MLCQEIAESQPMKKSTQFLCKLFWSVVCVGYRGLPQEIEREGVELRTRCIAQEFLLRTWSEFRDPVIPISID